MIITVICSIPKSINLLVVMLSNEHFCSKVTILFTSPLSHLLSNNQSLFLAQGNIFYQNFPLFSHRLSI